MEYEDSRNTKYQSENGVDFAGGVHIREEDRGVMRYAVFDGEECVSPDFGPLGEDKVIWFAKGYSRGIE